MKIRTGKITDLADIAAVERECFPPAEAATEEQFAERLAHYADHFWLLFDDSLATEEHPEGVLISFIDGFVTDEPDLTDEMYEKADLHNKDGKWQMIFGVNTIPSHRDRGYASLLLNTVILTALKQGRKGLVLTCKDELVGFYAKNGFVNEGPTEKSSHGGVVWNQMRYKF